MMRRQVVQILARLLGLQDLDEKLESLGDEEVIALAVRSASKLKERVVILLDALDEATQPKEIIRLLRSLG